MFRPHDPRRMLARSRRRSAPAPNHLVGALLGTAIALAVVVLLVTVPSAFPTVVATPAPPSPSLRDGSTPPNPDRASAALTVLDGLPERQVPAAGAYDRASFGQRWADVDRNGCDTRNDVLRRDLEDVTAKPGTRECVVVAGTLQDAYTGGRIDFTRGQGTSERVQIDHIVPLAWAWRFGASEWDDELRLRFANDPSNLQAVDGSANQAKAASGPARWLPPDPAYHCTYVERFVQIVADYGLALPADDRAAAREVLLRCS